MGQDSDHHGHPERDHAGQLQVGGRAHAQEDDHDKQHALLG